MSIKNRNFVHIFTISVIVWHLDVCYNKPKDTNEAEERYDAERN